MTRLAPHVSAALAFCAAFAPLTKAQVVGTQYRIAPVLSHSSQFAAFSNDLVDSTIDNATEPVGTTVTPGSSIFSGDLRTDLGGGHYSLRLTIQSTDNLAPIGYPLAGIPTDRFGIVMGPSIGMNGVTFENEEAATVTSASFSVLNSGGSLMLGPIDVTGAMATSDDSGGGWDGGTGFTFAQSMLTGPVGGYELIVNYRLGVAGEFRSVFPGCGQFGTEMTLEVDQLPFLGRTATYQVNHIPFNSLGTALVIGADPYADINLSFLGGVGCIFHVGNSFASLGMTVTGSQEAAVPLAIPNDVSLSALEVFVQALSLNQSGAYYASDVARITVGG